jgi:hypothetical protein
MAETGSFKSASPESETTISSLQQQSSTNGSMNPLEIPEILLIIFNIGSELDLEDYLDQPPDLPPGFCQPRTLKRFFRSASRVNKLWNDLICNVPSLWVTKISFYSDGVGLYPSPFTREHFAWAEELLAGSDNSDIDFTWYFHGYEPDDVSVEYQKHLLELRHWMDANVYPISHRVRQFSASGPRGPNKTFFEALVESASLQAWPRLRIFTFELGSSIDASRMLNAPMLRLASIRAFDWSHHRSPLANSNISILHASHNFDEGRMEGASIMMYFTPSLLSSLTELSLNLWDGSLCYGGIAFQGIPPELHFPRLEKLALYFGMPEHIWQIVRCIRAPLLAHLIARSLSRMGSFPDEHPVYEPRFPYLEKLDIGPMSPFWASVFIRTIPTSKNQLSTLCIDLVKQSQAGDIFLRENYPPCPMEFSCLKNLSMRSESFNARFFDTFGLFAATGHIHLYLYGYSDDDMGSVTFLSEHPLIFMNAKKVTVPRVEFVTCFEAPCLLHLVLDYMPNLPNFHHRTLAFHRDPRPLLPMGCHFSSSNLEVLELEVGFDSVVLTHQDLAPFCNLHTLVIKIRGPGIIVSIGEDLLTYALEKPEDVSDPCLPKLHTLGLDFELPSFYLPRNVDPGEDSYRDALLMARKFIEKRQELGFAIKNLRLIGCLPVGLPSDTNFKWLHRCPGITVECAKTPLNPFDYASSFTVVS